VTRTARRKQPRTLKVLGAVGYFATGMLLWIGGSFAWQAWQARASAAVRPTPPVKTEVVKAPPPSEDLAQWYQAAADRILNEYRTSTDVQLSNFDWHKAEICLERAVQLGATDDRTTAKLALARGYATLERVNGARYSDKAAAALRLHARDEFRVAATKAPGDADPHLALARVYVYSLPNPTKAMAEFAAAERLGATLTRREREQQGDVYRIRAQQELARDWRQAKRDAVVARGFYRQIAGFDQADAHLKELARIHAPAPRKPRAWGFFQWR
jgi:hypothetical protein